MSCSPLYNSPNRTSNVKRKMPESFYRPPVLKTQLFSAQEIINQRNIHHSHTASLPIENPAPLKSNLNSASSVNNLYDNPAPVNHQSLSNSSNNLYPMPTDSPKQAYPNPVQQQFFHAKTFSLPVSFDPNPMQSPNTYLSTSQTFAPPMRNYNPNGDIPLPPGWECEKASNGRFYYINHLTKTTTWDDPRKIYNLPTNQSDISNDLRLTITNTIPLPNGWEEARAANGEVYYIDHINKTTTWTDPRINLYMQQQQQKYGHNQQYNNLKMNFNNSYMHQSQYSNSTSSLSSSVLSISSNSSASSGTSNIYTQQQSGQLNLQNNNQFQNQYQTNLANLSPAEQHALNLKKSLDEVTKQKESICKQLEELSKQETLLKSKLSQQDLDDVLKMLKTVDIKMGSFSMFDKSNQTNQNDNLTDQLTPGKSKNSNSESQNVEKNNTSSGDLDSTFIAENGNNVLNTSTN